MKASSILESNSSATFFELHKKRNFSFGVKKEQTFSKADFLEKKVDKDLFGILFEETSCIWSMINLN